MNEREIFENYYEHVYKTSFFIIKDEDIAKDVTQETFIKIFKNIKNLRDDNKLKSWITTITTRTALDEIKKQKKRGYSFGDSLEDISDYKEKTHDEQIEENEFKDILNKLKPEFKEVLILKYIEQLSEKEISECLQIELGTVKSRIYRAKEQLSFFYNIGGGDDE